MAAKQLLFDEAARQALLRGVNKPAKPSRLRSGPKAATSLDKKFGSPTVTKDA
jgi:chaperonin GroEL